MLADAYGLYVNDDLLAAAGYDHAPTTLEELEEMALAMTTYNADGSIDVLGFNPLMGYYENTPTNWAMTVGATWLKDDGTQQHQLRPRLGRDHPVAEGLRRRDRLRQAAGVQRRHRSGVLGGQRLPDRPGRDEHRRRVPHRVHRRPGARPELQHGADPDARVHSDSYGGGYVTGNIGGIAKNSKNPELAWALLEYLTTDTDAVVKLSNGLKNAPTITSALESPDLEVSPQFQTFLDIMQNPNSKTTPPSKVGAGYQQALGDYWQKYQQGDGGDIAEGLEGVDKTINDSLALVDGP